MKARAATWSILVVVLFALWNTSTAAPVRYGEAHSPHRKLLQMDVAGEGGAMEVPGEEGAPAPEPSLPGVEVASADVALDKKAKREPPQTGKVIPADVAEAASTIEATEDITPRPDTASVQEDPALDLAVAAAPELDPLQASVLLGTTEGAALPPARVIRVPATAPDAPAGAGKFKNAPPNTHKLENEFLVTLAPEADVAATVDDLVKGKGPVHKTSWDIGAKSKGFSIRVPPGQSDAILATLAADPRVLTIHPNVVVQVTATQTGATWGLDRIDQASRPLSTTYNYFSTGAGVYVYVVDTGLRTDHSEFSGRVIPGAFVGSSTVTSVWDTNGHGTHVSGTVLGKLYGVAKSASVVPCRYTSGSSGSSDAMIACINWAAGHTGKPNHKKIINISSRSPAFQPVDDAVNAAYNKGIAVIVAAGNDYAYACSYSPARTYGALTLGATTNTDYRASYSNYGGCLNLFAPGDSIKSAGITSTTATAIMSGTSMAAPHAAGVAARIVGGTTTPCDAYRGTGSFTQCIYNLIQTQATPGKVINPGTGSPNKLLFRSPSA